MLAHGFAATKYRHDHPDASEEEAWQYAARCWRLHLDAVFDFLAISRAVDEAEAAPWN